MLMEEWAIDGVWEGLLCCRVFIILSEILKSRGIKTYPAPPYEIYGMPDMDGKDNGSGYSFLRPWRSSLVMEAAVFLTEALREPKRKATRRETERRVSLPKPVYSLRLAGVVVVRR